MLNNDLTIEFLRALGRIHTTDDLLEICELENIICVDIELHSDIELFFQFVGTLKFLYVNTIYDIDKVCCAGNY